MFSLKVLWTPGIVQEHRRNRKFVLCGENVCVNSLLDETDWAPSNRLVDGERPPSQRQNREYRGFQVLCTEE